MLGGCGKGLSNYVQHAFLFCEKVRSGAFLNTIISAP